MRVGSRSIGVLYALITLILFSCSPILDKEEYIEWIKSEENGLYAKNSVGNYLLELQYLPSQYVWLQRNQHGQTEELQLDSIETIQFYTLTVSSAIRGRDMLTLDSHKQADIQRKLYYLSFGLQNDIKLVDNGDTLACVLYHFERVPNQDGKRRISLGFENRLPDNKKSQVIIESPLFGSLPIKFNFNKSDIPQLSL